MLNYLKRPHRRRIPAFAHPNALIAASIIVMVIFQSACFFNRKHKTAEAVAAAPVRLVLLPFNVPQANKDLRWTALAAPILMAKAGAKSANLEIIPLWQTMPYALENGGASRTFTQESAANVANWLSAKWVVLGEMTPTKRGVLMVIDFIPSRSTMVPFRYMRSGRVDTVAAHFYDAYNQFLRYLVAKPIQRSRGDQPTMTSVRGLAETLDSEYGWFVEADPGKATDALTELMHSDEILARSLFSPVLYPNLAPKK